MFFQEREHRQPTRVWGHDSDADGVDEQCDSPGEVMLSRAAIWEHIKQRRKRKLQAEATVGFRAGAVAECQGLEWKLSAWERGGSLERHNFLFCHCDTNTAEFFGYRVHCHWVIWGTSFSASILSRIFYYRWSAFHWLFYFTSTKK